MVNNKANIFIPLVKITLVVVAFLIILLFIFKLTDTTKDSGKDAVCAASIQQHIAFIESNMLVDEEIDKRTAGVGSLFIDASVEVPPIKCDTKLVKSDAKDAEEAEKEILTKAVRTWDLFNKGESWIYKDINDKGEASRVCFVRYVFNYSKDLDLFLIKRAMETPVSDLIAYKKSDDSVFEYLSISPILAGLFENGPVKDLEKAAKDVENKIKEVEDKNFNTTDDFFKSPDSMDLAIANCEWERAVVDNTNIDPEYINKKVEEKMKNKCLNYDGSRAFPVNTSENIAIVFLQCHRTETGFGFFSKNEHFFESSLYIIPYDEAVLEKIGCEYMPVEFED